MPNNNNNNNSFLVLRAAKVPPVGWHSAKATGFEATRPGLWTLVLSFLQPVSTVVVISENPNTAIHRAVKTTPFRGPEDLGSSLGSAECDLGQWALDNKKVLP